MRSGLDMSLRSRSGLSYPSPGFSETTVQPDTQALTQAVALNNRYGDIKELLFCYTVASATDTRHAIMSAAGTSNAVYADYTASDGLVGFDMRGIPTSGGSLIYPDAQVNIPPLVPGCFLVKYEVEEDGAGINATHAVLANGTWTTGSVLGNMADTGINMAATLYTLLARSDQVNSTGIANGHQNTDQIKRFGVWGWTTRGNGPDLTSATDRAKFISNDSAVTVTDPSEAHASYGGTGSSSCFWDFYTEDHWNLGTPISGAVSVTDGPITFTVKDGPFTVV